MAHRTTVYRHRVRYLEADQQGVVFNMWYLGYFDEAMTLFLEQGGLPYNRMLEAGFDVHLVHSEIDWKAPLRFPEEFGVEVGVDGVDGVGRSSFALRFVVRGPAGEVAVGRTVYVVVATDGSGKRPIPALLASALGDPPG
ncbi:MAG TPA: acyl-CoA thioesterase [Mycobacterium sp.]|uniref:acyl-CoA thioesterase n=1 Tax=Mycobacterium sp. TaxID=1785 RepID=UPI002D48B78C|nr:acyl-CoA thioesterase [Mycobacterium sp.]HXY63887.1 acyl-CoA thioesterase [Mycobacterium sp.]